jgi:serine/threonine-protein kinase
MDPPEGAPPIPPEVQRVVLCCLAKDPEQRFQDMDQLLHALKVLTGEATDLGRSSELPAAFTPHSGVQAVPGADPGAFSASISLSAPSVSGAMPVSNTGQVAASVPPPARSGPNAVLAVVGGALALGVAAAILFFVLGRSEGDEQARASLPDEPTGLAASPSADDSDLEEPAAPEPVVRSVLVELDSTPAGATVEIGDQEYGPTPAQVELTGDQAEAGAELTFVFSRNGFRRARITRTVPEEGALEVSARMRRMAAAQTRRGSSRRTSSSDEGPRQTVTPAGYRESPY